MDLKGQVKEQVDYSKTHIGKTLGIGAGVATGVIYGMSGNKEGWVISAFALGGAVAGAVLGGMFDNSKNAKEATSNAIGRANTLILMNGKRIKGHKTVVNDDIKYQATGANDLYIGGTEDLAAKSNAYVTSGGVEDSNAIGANVINRLVPNAESNVAPMVDNKIGRSKLSNVNTLVRPVNVSNRVGSVARQQSTEGVTFPSRNFAGDPPRKKDGRRRTMFK